MWGGALGDGMIEMAGVVMSKGLSGHWMIGDLTECKPVPAHTHHPAFDSHPYLSLAFTRTCPHCAGAGMIGLLRSYDPSRSD